MGPVESSSIVVGRPVRVVDADRVRSLQAQPRRRCHLPDVARRGERERMLLLLHLLHPAGPSLATSTTSSTTTSGMGRVGGGGGRGAARAGVGALVEEEVLRRVQVADVRRGRRVRCPCPCPCPMPSPAQSAR